MLYFDPIYLMVMIPALLLSLLAQFLVSSAFSKWSRIRNSLGLTGVHVAERLIRGAGLNGVQLEGIPGQHTDHYDPASHTVRLSEEVATRPSVAAMAVVAHELGHAQQHAERSILISMRNFLLPAMQFSPMVSYLLILGGLLLNIAGLIQLGIVFYGVVVLFMVLTLPVEFDASRRGLIMLRETGLMTTTEEIGGSRAVLTAAALTYVAAAVTAVLNLLYYISLASRRD
ncbi:MAG TPA: zinc metallopeptidase [Phototrophicaceae bacterium]|nr:zinc metallopeptidase [Phototrophicaceae bacterium]